jgi:nitroimidazol reductase NimA-like FMN-containing flavoprotein (pyridoxamine 5'-phosphate oxidase superfamily)
MFRDMRRYKQQLSDEECEKILAEQPRGVLSVLGEDGYPYGLPINFLYRDGHLYFHCAKTGHKVDALKADPRASFCTYDQGYLIEGKRGLNIKSVIAFGRVAFVDDEERSLAIGRDLCLKYFDEDYAQHELEKSGHRMQILDMTIDHMTGKLVNES